MAVAARVARGAEVWAGFCFGFADCDRGGEGEAVDEVADFEGEGEEGEFGRGGSW